MEITTDDFSFDRLLVKRYTIYRLDELDVVVLLVMDALLDLQPKSLITCDTLASYMSASKDEIDASLSKLIGKQYVEFVDDGRTLYSSIDKFKQKIFDDYVKDRILQEKNSGNNLRDSTIYVDLEEMTGTTLAPLERDYVTRWLQSGATDSMIKEACTRSLTKSGHISFKAANQMISALLRSEDRMEYGVSAKSDDHDQTSTRDIIMNTDWLHDDDE